MKEIEIIKVTITDEAIETAIYKDREVVMKALANSAITQYAEGDENLLSLWIGVVMCALACDMTGKLEKKTLKFMEQQIPILRATLALQQERIEEE